ncbi:MAG: ABC transporter ATP-binding protein, partial [Geminicoccaceae bacterium]
AGRRRHHRSAGTRAHPRRHRARIRAGIALVPEGRRVFADLSVEENLVVGGFSRSKAETARNRALTLELFPRLGERLG